MSGRGALMVKRLGGLRPADGIAADLLGSIAEGEVVKAEITRPRRLRHHQWFFAVLEAVYDAQSLYSTREQLLAAIKVAVGYGDTVKLPDGRVIVVPGSIAFHAMDESAFSEFSAKVVRLICRKVLPGVEEDVFRAEIEARLAGQGTRSAPPRKGRAVTSGQLAPDRRGGQARGAP